MRKRPLRAGGCTAATAIRRACRPRALRVCGSTTARQARAAQSDAAASKSSRASSAAATDGDPLVRVPADAFVPSNRRAWALRTCSTWAATAAVDMVAPQHKSENVATKGVVSARPRERFRQTCSPAPPANKAPVSTLRSLPRTRIYPIPHLQARPHARSNTKCLTRLADGSMNAGPSTHMLSSTRTARTRVLSVRATNTQPCVRPTRARGVLVKPSKIACAAVDATGGTCPCPLLSLSVTRRGGRTPTLDERRAHALRAFRG